VCVRISECWRFLFYTFSVKVQFIESAHIMSVYLWIFCTCVYLCSHHFQDHIHLVPPAVATLLTELDLLLHLTELESSPCSQIHMAPKRHHCVPSRQCPKDSHCFGFYCWGLVLPNLKFHRNKIMEDIFLWVWLPCSTVFWDASVLSQIAIVHYFFLWWRNLWFNTSQIIHALNSEHESCLPFVYY
jgi:hypothetical protein